MNKLLVFGGTHCASCKKMVKMLDLSNIPHEYKDVEKDVTEARRYFVGSVPTLVFLDSNDRPITSTVGMTDIATIKRMMSV